MIVNVPFYHYMSVRLPRKKDDTAVAVPDTHPVELREVEDSILVARIPPIKGRKSWLEIRWHDDRYWMPAHQRLEESDATFLGMHAIAADLQVGGETRGLQIASSSIPNRFQRFDSIEAMNAKSITTSLRDQQTAEMDEKALDCIVVEGVFHVPVDEPVFHISISGERAFPYLRTTDSIRFHRDDVEAYWRIDDWDRMVDNINRHGDSIKPPKENYRAEVMRPDLLQWDREKELFWEHVKHEYASYRATGFGDADRETFELYVDLRTAMKDADKNSDETVVTVGDAVIALQDHLRSLDPTSTEFSGTIDAYDQFQHRRGIGVYAPAIGKLI